MVNRKGLDYSIEREKMVRRNKIIIISLEKSIRWGYIEMVYLNIYDSLKIIVIILVLVVSF